VVVDRLSVSLKLFRSAANFRVLLIIRPNARRNQNEIVGPAFGEGPPPGKYDWSGQRRQDKIGCSKLVPHEKSPPIGQACLDLDQDRLNQSFLLSSTVGRQREFTPHSICQQRVKNENTQPFPTRHTLSPGNDCDAPEA